LRFGHLRFSRAGILREVIEDFGRHRDAVGLDFRSWVETRYVADEVALRFRARSLTSNFMDLLLRREG
jgi:hypothetical protein